MLGFLFKKETSSAEILNDFYSKLREMYSFESISDERKDYLKSTMSKYGYMPYPHIKALEELSDAEVLWALESKWENEGVFKDGKFEFSKISTLARNNVKNSSWMQKEGHNIKLINLAGLGNGNESDSCGRFMDWLRQLLILPTGNKSNNIFGTTMYLIPFHPREFGCAYLPTASCVSPNLEDKNIGFALTGSFCTFRKAIDEIKKLVNLGANVLPIMSYNSYNLDTKFGKAKDFIEEIEDLR